MKYVTLDLELYVRQRVSAHLLACSGTYKFRILTHLIDVDQKLFISKVPTKVNRKK